MSVFIDILLKNKTTGSHRKILYAGNSHKLQYCEPYHTSGIPLSPGFPETVDSARWQKLSQQSCPLVISWVVLSSPGKEGASWLLQTIKNSSLLPRFFHLICFQKTILSQWVPGSGRTKINLFTLPKAAIVTAGAPRFPQRRPNLIDFQ